MAEKFKFQQFKRTFDGIATDKVKELLKKWGMCGQLQLQMFTYNKYFQPYQKDDFARDFFQDRTVQSHLQILSSTGSWGPLGSVNVVDVEVKSIPCTITNMDFFDKLFTKGLVRKSGEIVKCYDEYVEGFTISDELRKMHIMEDSEFFDVFTENEKEEFLFQIFKHICLGGDICQYEDTVQPYLETAKTIYKDLISVHKDANTKLLQTSSCVYKVYALGSNSEVIYPPGNRHHQTFAYLIVDPLKRHVFVWHHQWRGIAW